MYKATPQPQLTRYFYIVVSLITYCLMWGVWLNPSQAQGGWHFEATVDRTEITVDEKIILTVVINPTTDANLELILGHQPDFSVVNTSITEEAHTTDTQLNQIKIVHKYDLYPTKAGHLVLNPISIQFDNQIFTSEPIDIQVTENFVANASLSPSIAHFNVADIEAKLGNERYFVEAEVDSFTPYLGQQILYTFRLYQRDKPTGKAIYLKPAFEGFWVADQPSQKEHYWQQGNNTYYIFELQTALFPIKPLPLSIHPSQALISHLDSMSDMTLVSNAVDITVQPLPDHAPTHFQGAVGHFEIEATVDSREIALDEPVALTIMLKGQGNIETLPNPIWPAMPTWESFDSEAQMETVFVDNRIGGVRRFVRTLIPLQVGKLIIPPVTYAIFDPDIQVYRTLETQPFLITVTEQANTETVAMAVSPGLNLRPLKPPAFTLQTHQLPLTSLPNYWLSWGLPFIALGVYVASYRGYRFYRNSIKQEQKSALKKAERTLLKTDLAIEKMGEILVRYFSDKLNYPQHSLNTEVLIKVLIQHNVKAELIVETRDLLRRVELHRYASSLSGTLPIENSNALQTQVMTLIQSLDIVLSNNQQNSSTIGNKSTTDIPSPSSNGFIFDIINIYIFILIAVVSFFCGWVLSHYVAVSHIQNELLTSAVLLALITVTYLAYTKKR